MILKIVAVVVGVLGLTAGALYMMSSSDTVTHTQTQQLDSLEDSSFSKLILRKEDVACEFSSTEGLSSSEGIFYFDSKNNRFRVDVDSAIDGESFVTHVVNDSQKIYTWGTSMAQGMVVDASIGNSVAHSVTDVDFPVTSPDDIVGDDHTTYDCRAWKVDETIFTPDASVEFMDMQEIMEQMTGAIPDGFEPPALTDLEVN